MGNGGGANGRRCRCAEYRELPGETVATSFTTCISACHKAKHKPEPKLTSCCGSRGRVRVGSCSSSSSRWRQRDAAWHPKMRKRPFYSGNIFLCGDAAMIYVCFGITCHSSSSSSNALCENFELNSLPHDGSL